MEKAVVLQCMFMIPHSFPGVYGCYVPLFVSETETDPDFARSQAMMDFWPVEANKRKYDFRKLSEGSIPHSDPRGGIRIVLQIVPPLHGRIDLERIISDFNADRRWKMYRLAVT